MIHKLIRAILLLIMATTAIAEARAISPDDVKIIMKEAEKGNAKAQSLLGDMYTIGLGIRQDNTKAIEWYEKSAAQNDASAQYSLGLAYALGRGVHQDYVIARQWLEKAVAQNHAKAQVNLGVIYYKGYGVRQNISTAKEWFGRACDNGFQEGCDRYRELNINQ